MKERKLYTIEEILEYFSISDLALKYWINSFGFPAPYQYKEEELYASNEIHRWILSPVYFDAINAYLDKKRQQFTNISEENLMVEMQSKVVDSVALIQ